MGPVVVIPARRGSSRFPNKPLALLRGRSLVFRTWQIATQASAVARVIVATDDAAIADHVRIFGGEAMITPPARNGCERAAFVAKKLKATPSVVVNLQGDAVLTPKAAIEAAAQGVLAESNGGVRAATVALPLQGDMYQHYLAHKTSGRSSGTTVVCDRASMAMYFSKVTLPHVRHSVMPDTPQALRHLGVYAFTADALELYAKLEPTPLEQTEGLEQLRWLEHGHKMRVEVIAAPARPIWSIDYPEDLAVAEDILQRYGEVNPC